MTSVKKLLAPSLFMLLAIAAFIRTLRSRWCCSSPRGHVCGSTVKRYRELGAGFAIGAGLFAAIALVRALLVGASWHFNAQTIVGVLTIGLAMVLLSAVVEELLFRGYAFDRLKTLASAPIALVLSLVHTT